MSLTDRTGGTINGKVDLAVTNGEIRNIGNALPLTVVANINVVAADRNDNSGIKTSNQEKNSDQTVEKENATSQHLNPKNIFIGPKKNREKCEKRPKRTIGQDTK